MGILIFIILTRLFLGALSNHNRLPDLLSVINRTGRFAPVFNIGKIGGKYFLTDSDWYGRHTWAEALDFCQYNGFRPGTIKSEEENQFLTEFLLEVDESICFWLPATDFASEGRFHWLGKGSPEFTFTSWEPGHPHISRLNNCVLLKSTGTWMQAPCSSKYIKLSENDSFGCLPLCEI